eukprot:8438171-Karenia_brevis.AAC.1
MLLPFGKKLTPAPLSTLNVLGKYVLHRGHHFIGIKVEDDGTWLCMKNRKVEVDVVREDEEPEDSGGLPWEWLQQLQHP